MLHRQHRPAKFPEFDNLKSDISVDSVMSDLPGRGCDMSKNTVRIIQLFSLGLVLSLCSCGSVDSDPSSDVMSFQDAEVLQEVFQEEVKTEPPCGDFCPAGESSAPDPSLLGPFPVGVKTVTLELLDQDGQPRSTRVDIWYPTDDEFKDGPFEQIDLYEDATPEAKEVLDSVKDIIVPIGTRAVREAPVRFSEDSYPVVVFSHGSFGVRFQSVFFTINLASHGYIVLSPDHTDNTLYDMLEAQAFDPDLVILSAFNRTLDIVGLLDMMEGRNDDPADEFYQRADMENVGISGHSLGGYSAMYTTCLDERIDAVVGMSPAGGFLDMTLSVAENARANSLSDYPVPVMIMVGLLDRTIDPYVESVHPYEQMSTPKYLLRFDTAGHFTFSDICSLDLANITQQLDISNLDDALTDGCAEENIPVAEAHKVINRYAIGMLNYYLRGSPGSAEYFKTETPPEGASYDFQEAEGR